MITDKPLGVVPVCVPLQEGPHPNADLDPLFLHVARLCRLWLCLRMQMDLNAGGLVSHQGALDPTPVIEKKGVLPSCLEEALSRWSQVTWFK